MTGREFVNDYLSRRTEDERQQIARMIGNREVYIIPKDKGEQYLSKYSLAIGIYTFEELDVMLCWEVVASATMNAHSHQQNYVGQYEDYGHNEHVEQLERCVAWKFKRAIGE